MNILNTLSLKINRQTKINFDGVDLFSDAGLLHIKEFVSKLSIDRLFSYLFKTNDLHYLDITLTSIISFR